MKIKAAVEIEFEGNALASESTLKFALVRGLHGLKRGIERRVSRLTEIKKGSLSCTVVKQEIVGGVEISKNTQPTQGEYDPLRV
jgi:hypothetical protein